MIHVTHMNTSCHKYECRYVQENREVTEEEAEKAREEVNDARLEATKARLIAQEMQVSVCVRVCVT